MTYANIADMTESPSLRRRLTAAAAEEHKTQPYEGWVAQHIWEIAASPGWATAWASALAGGVTDPGANESVITDSMILATIQPIPPIPEPPAPEPAPVITVLEPATASITDADFEGHVRGTGFVDGSVIIWNGAEEPTRFVDDTDVWTIVKPSVVTSPTVLNVYVRNPDGQVSNIVTFTWTDDTPEE